MVPFSQTRRPRMSTGSRPIMTNREANVTEGTRADTSSLGANRRVHRCSAAILQHHCKLGDDLTTWAACLELRQLCASVFVAGVWNSRQNRPGRGSSARRSCLSLRRDRSEPKETGSPGTGKQRVHLRRARTSVLTRGDHPWKDQADRKTGTLHAFELLVVSWRPRIRLMTRNDRARASPTADRHDLRSGIRPELLDHGG